MLRRCGTSVPSTSLCLARRWHGGATGEICKEKLRTTRDARFASLTEADRVAFRSLLGPKGVVEDDAGVRAFNTDWFKEYHGASGIALLPSSTEEVSAVLKHCASRKLAVVPQGGNTGFVGGSVPVFDEVLISLKRMNKIHEIDDLAGTLKCQSGCVLEWLDEQLKPHQLMMPIDLGAKGSCHIGGNVSTAAGGLRFMRYGSMHGNVLGLKAVLPSGEVLDTMNTLKKDNTGYDLKQLFIGAEGTLGIVTDVALQLAPLPASVQTLFLGAPNWNALCDIFRLARSELGEILSAAEMIDGDTLDLVVDIMKDKSPLGDETAPYYMLIETNGSNAVHDKDKLMQFLTKADEKGIIKAGTIAESGTQTKHMWKLREACALAPAHRGHIRWYDISMPSGAMRDMIDDAKAMLASHGWADRCKAIGFGHFGDGNLHLNIVSMPNYDAEVVKASDKFVYEYSRSRGYSVSAEHGIGLQKRGVLTFTKKPETVEWMKKMKHLIDPDGIMNPYKMFGPVATFP